VVLQFNRTNAQGGKDAKYQRGTRASRNNITSAAFAAGKKRPRFLSLNGCGLERAVGGADMTAVGGTED